MTTQILRLGIILIFFSNSVLIAQTNQEKAREKARTAIELMDDGKIDAAVILLKEAQELDPESSVYPYEIAYSYYIQENYKEAIQILEKIMNYKDVQDRLYQLLGNSYDYTGKPEKAITIYEDGLKKFPNSGNLHLELGIMQIKSKKYEQALATFEKGIYVQPAFPSNYYWAARLYCNSGDEMWGMIYGEIFMNLERNSKRTSEISKLLFDTYKREIKITSDTTLSVSFCENNLIKDPSKIPFSMIYEPTLMLSIIGEKNITLNSLDRIRTGFIKNYYEKNFQKSYPNVLFDYQKTIMEAGHFESYNHWILMKGDEEGFDKWHEYNKDKWESFVKWFTDNPMKIDDQQRFFKGQYD